METSEIRTIDMVRNIDQLNSNTVDVLRRLLVRYPYYQTLRLLLLENLYKIHSPEFNEELRRSAFLLADRRVLFNLIEGENYVIEPQTNEVSLEDNTGEDRTASLIDKYLDDRPMVDKPVRKVSPADAVKDYASYLMQMEEEEGKNPYRSGDNEDVLVKKEEHKREATPRPMLSDKSDDELETPIQEDIPREDFFTETLAQIYIKQHKYERALEIITALSANNPKKNSYFADQIRFLEKLIRINTNKKIDNV